MVQTMLFLQGHLVTAKKTNMQTLKLEKEKSLMLSPLSQTLISSHCLQPKPLMHQTFSLWPLHYVIC